MKLRTFLGSYNSFIEESVCMVEWNCRLNRKDSSWFVTNFLTSYVIWKVLSSPIFLSHFLKTKLHGKAGENRKRCFRLKTKYKYWNSKKSKTQLLQGSFTLLRSCIKFFYQSMKYFLNVFIDRHMPFLMSLQN